MMDLMPTYQIGRALLLPWRSVSGYQKVPQQWCISSYPQRRGSSPIRILHLCFQPSRGPIANSSSGAHFDLVYLQAQLGFARANQERQYMRLMGTKAAYGDPFMKSKYLRVRKVLLFFILSIKLLMPQMKCYILCLKERKDALMKHWSTLRRCEAERSFV